MDQLLIRCSEQIKHMANRFITWRLSISKLLSYNGFAFLLIHHEVLKPNFISTTYRILFDSLANFKDYSLSNYSANVVDIIDSVTPVADAK